MKILHINDLAGVAGCLVKYLRKAGHEADLISFMNDKEFGFTEFYGGRHFQNQQIMLYYLKGLIPKYDVLHVHFTYPLLEWLYQFNKPIVMHYHGTEIATQTHECRIADRKCRAVIVAGQQLMQYHPRAQYLPTIVDTDHFYPRNVKKNGKILAFDVPYIDRKEVTKRILETDRDRVDWIDRLHNAIPHSELPEFLCQYDEFVDIRYHKQRGMLTDRSKTALECMAVGTPIITEHGWMARLPEQHKPENVIVNLTKIYEGLLS